MPTDAQLLQTIRTGKGDTSIYTGDDYIFLKSMMGGIEPADSYYQVYKNAPADILAKGAIGTNNIVSAKAVMNSWTIKLSRNPDADEKMYFGFEEKIIEAFDKKYEKGKYGDLQFHLFTLQGLIEAVIMDINHDFTLVTSAILLVCIYTFLMLGSFSPTHCRCVVTIVGLLCILLAYLSGFGLLYLLGGETTGVH